MFPAITDKNRSYWMSKPDSLSQHRTTPDLPIECDIVIIGSGYAGATMSYYIQQNSHASIVMLEARETCSGATGRNGGHMKPDAFYSFTKYAQLYGEAEAERLLRFEQDHVPAMSQLIQEEGIECDFVLTRAIDLFMTASEGQYAERSLNARRHAGGQVDDIQIIPKDELEAVSRVRSRPAFGVSYPAGCLHPYKFVHHLLRMAVNRGLNLQTDTPVTRVSKSDGVWQVTTDRGVVRATQCVFATNAYTGNLLQVFKDKIVPVRGTVSSVSLPESCDILKHTYGIRTKGADSDYMICRKDRTVILGGAKSTFLHEPKLWYGVIDDSKSICAESEQYFRSYLSKHFAVTDASCETVWTGILGYSNDFLPYVGELPSTTEDQTNGFVIAGFHGHGMPRVLLCAKSLAAKILGRTSACEGLPRAYLLTAERLSSSENHILSDMTSHLENVNGDSKLAATLAPAATFRTRSASAKL